MGNRTIDYADSYKYLGVVLNEFLDYKAVASVMSDSAGRALGALISKYKGIGNLGFNTYSKCFESSVSSVLEYCSGVWGFVKFSQCEQIRARALRVFLGVHRHTANAVIFGDTGWATAVYRQHENIIRLWNRLLLMDNNMIAKRVFVWDYGLRKANWSASVKSILENVNLEHCFSNLQVVSVHSFNILSAQKETEKWREILNNKPKLRTYKTFKFDYCPENYILLSQAHRSLLARLRSGTLPLEIETGRFVGTPLEERTCKICNENVIEDESHFVFECTKYSHFRIGFPDEASLALMFNDYLNVLAKYVQNAFSFRQTLLFR